MPYYSDIGLSSPSSLYSYHLSGPYSNHSSILASNHVFNNPYLKAVPSRFRGYKPHLSTITESQANSPRRINSPKLRLHSSPKISIPRPIKINTADIDVSVNKYRSYDRPIKVKPVEKVAPQAPAEEKDAKPSATIRRDRTTVRLQTIHRDKIVKDIKSWRDNFEPSELVIEEKRQRKTPGEILKEKFLIRSRSKDNIHKKASVKKNNVAKTPSFHDICTAITADNIDDELNPGQPMEIQRRQSRQFSSGDIFKEIRRNSADLSQEDSEILDVLLQNQEGKQEDESRGSVRKKKVTKKKSNERLTIPERDRSKSPKKISKTQSKEKLPDVKMHQESEETEEQSSLKRRISESIAEDLPKRLLKSQSKENVSDGQSLLERRESKLLAIDKLSDIDTSPKSGLQRRLTQKNMRRTSSDSNFEENIKELKGDKDYQNAIRDISQVEIEEIAVKPKQIITATVDVEINNKPTLKAIVDEVEVEESPKPKADKKFKFNVIVEEIEERARSKSRSVTPEMEKKKKIVQTLKKLTATDGSVHLPKAKELVLLSILQKKQHGHLGHILEDIKEVPKEEDVAKAVETQKIVAIVEDIKTRARKLYEAPESKADKAIDLNNNTKLKNKSKEIEKSKEELEKKIQTLKQKVEVKNAAKVKEDLDKKQAVEVKNVQENGVKPKAVWKAKGELNKKDAVVEAKVEEAAKPKEIIKPPKVEAIVETKPKIEEIAIKSKGSEQKAKDEPEKIEAKQNGLEAAAKENVITVETPKPKEEINIEPEEIKSPVLKKKIIKKADKPKPETPEEKPEEKTEEKPEEIPEAPPEEKIDNFWDEVGAKTEIKLYKIDKSKLPPLAFKDENHNEVQSPKKLISKRSLMQKANKDDPDLEVFDVPEPEPLPEPEPEKFVPLQSNRISHWMHPWKKPDQLEECPIEIFAKPKVIRGRHYPRPRQSKVVLQQKVQEESEEESEDESSSSSEEEESSSSESASEEEESNTVFGNKIGASTSSNDSGFHSGAHRSRNKGSTSDSRDSPTALHADNPTFALESNDTPEEYSQSSTFVSFQKSGRITPPATTIPRFRKYCVDDFNFLKVLGKGSFGKVLLAELKDTEYYYAIKCLKKDVVLEDDDVECTLIERKVLALGTKHPYLCHLLCTFQTESHLFFVMEYLNGGDLMFHIQQSGRFPESQAKFYGAEIVSGLKFLHNKGIVYRDLKLDNILLDFDGHVRIADFGMCKLQIFLDRMADTFCGTPDYMAPEIIKGLHYNQCVDWWSFGVLLYEMLLGQSPFSGCDEDELFWSICNEKPVLPRFLSSEATAILLLFLEKDASKRLGNRFCSSGDIQDQPFFRQIDWHMLEARQLEPPFKPDLKHPLDTQYFDRTFTVEKAKLTPIEQTILQSMDQTQFQGFSYTNPNATDK